MFFLQTLESGVVVGQGIKVVHGKCVKNNKRKDWTIWQTELSMGKFQNSINVWPLTLTMQCGIFGGVFFLGEMKFVFFLIFFPMKNTISSTYCSSENMH